MAILHLHRHSPAEMSPQAPSIPQVFGGTDKASADKTSSEAASSIARFFADALIFNFIDQCWFTCTGAQLAACTQVIRESNTATRSSAALSSIQAHRRLELLLPTIKGVAAYWPGAEAVFNLFSGLLDRGRFQTQMLVDNGKDTQPGSTSGIT